jgi:hypothetical protein
MRWHLAQVDMDPDMPDMDPFGYEKRWREEMNKDVSNSPTRQPGHDSCPGCHRDWDLDMRHAEDCPWEAAFNEGVVRLRLSFEDAQERATKIIARDAEET